MKIRIDFTLKDYFDIKGLPSKLKDNLAFILFIEIMFSAIFCFIYSLKKRTEIKKSFFL